MDTDEPKKDRKTRTYAPALQDEHDTAMQMANRAYALEDFPQCIAYARRAIKAVPSTTALQLLYRVHIDMGKPKRAMEYRFVEAMLRKNDLGIWEELLEYYRASSDANPLEKSRLIVCILGRILVIYSDQQMGGINGPKRDEIIHLTLYRASLVTQIGEGSRAIRMYKRLLEHFPFHVEAYAEIATLTYRLGNPTKAIQLLHDYITRVNVGDGDSLPFAADKAKPTVSPSHILHIASIRAEVQNETGKYLDAIAGIESLVETHGFSLHMTPALFARWIVAKVLLANTEASSFVNMVTECMRDTPQQSLLDSVDLLYDTANLFLRCNAPVLARIIFEKLLHSTEIVESTKAQSSSAMTAALHLGIACCLRDMHDTSHVEPHLQAVLKSDPFHVDSLCMLADHYINECYAKASGNDTAAMNLLRENRAKIIDLLNPKPETDTVLALRLLNQRARFYVYHDRTNSNRLPLARADLNVIVEAAMRDAPESTIIGGILNAEGAHRRKRKGWSSSAQTLYPSSTLTMTQVLDGSTVGPNGQKGDIFDNASMAAQSVASTFRWESRPSDRPDATKSHRFHTESLYSYRKESEAPKQKTSTPSTIFQHFSRRSKEAQELPNRTPPGTADELDIIDDGVSTAGSVGNLEDLDAFDELLATEISARIDQIQCDEIPEIDPQASDNMIVQRSSVVLHWLDVKIALQKEEEIFATFCLFISLLSDPSEQLYWTSKLHASRRIEKPALRLKVELQLLKQSVLNGNDALTGEQLARLLRFQSHASFGSSFASTDANGMWNVLNDILTNIKVPFVVRRVTRNFLMRFRSAEKAACAEHFPPGAAHIESILPFLTVIGHLSGQNIIKLGAQWSLVCYYRALSLNKATTLPLLCLATFYARICRNRKMNHVFSLSWEACWYFALQHREEMRNERGALGWVEGTYNIGRIAQHAGLPHIATACYKEVLRNQLIADVKAAACRSTVHKATVLRHNAAYNLHTLYRSSGNYDLAYAVLMQHVQI